MGGKLRLDQPHEPNSMQTFHTTFAQLPLAQCAFPSKKRTLDGQQEPEVEDSMQQESVYSEAHSKKTRVASFFEDTDYSAELKASRDAIMGQDTAMDAQDDEDLDLDEEEANYVPKCESCSFLSLHNELKEALTATWEPHFAS